MKIALAKISSTHGLKGGVKVDIIYMDMVDIFLDPTTQFFINAKKITLTIKSFNGKNYLCNINDIDTIEHAKLLVGQIIEVEIFEPKLPITGETLMNFDVLFNNKLYGTVIDFGNYGSGETIEILLPNNSIEIYLLTEDWVQDINYQSNTITMKRVYCNILK